MHRQLHAAWWSPRIVLENQQSDLDPVHGPWHTYWPKSDPLDFRSERAGVDLRLPYQALPAVLCQRDGAEEQKQRTSPSKSMLFVGKLLRADRSTCMSLPFIFPCLSAKQGADGTLLSLNWRVRKCDVFLKNSVETLSPFRFPAQSLFVLHRTCTFYPSQMLILSTHMLIMQKHMTNTIWENK